MPIGVETLKPWKIKKKGGQNVGKGHQATQEGEVERPKESLHGVRPALRMEASKDTPITSFDSITWTSLDLEKEERLSC